MRHNVRGSKRGRGAGGSAGKARVTDAPKSADKRDTATLFLDGELERRVKERTGQVEALATRLTLAEQAERLRLSHFLHDDLQQLLYSAEMKIATMKKEQDLGKAEAVRRVCDEIQALIQRAIDGTRQLSVELSPPVLKDEGLVAALEWLGAHMKKTHGLGVDVKGPHLRYPMSEDMRVLVYQAVRELLFNVVKHAGAARVGIEIGAAGDDFRVDVCDDGRGIDMMHLGGVDGDESVGLRSLRERLGLFGGRVDVEAKPGGGTHVAIFVPQARMAGPA